MKTQAIHTMHAPQAVGPYSQAIKASNLLFVSGQLPLDAQGRMAGPGVAEQTQQCLLNLKAILQEAGAGLSCVVKTTVFMTDLKEFAVMNEVYAKHFQAPYPGRATVQVAALPKGAAVEIEAIACLE